MSDMTVTIRTRMFEDMCDRIEELEADLAKLEDAARSALEYVEHNEKEWGVNLAMGNKLRAALTSRSNTTC